MPGRRSGKVRFQFSEFPKNFSKNSLHAGKKLTPFASFWGEQQAVVALVAAACIISGVEDFLLSRE